jgi:hypothetical protein
MKEWVYLYQQKYSLGFEDLFYDDSFPYFYDGTTTEDYQSALACEGMGCCVTKMEYANSNGIGKNIVSFLILFIQYYMISFPA